MDDDGDGGEEEEAVIAFASISQTSLDWNGLVSQYYFPFIN
jgi:hypothetical protein